MTGEASLLEIASTLYAGPLDDFIPERNRQAKALSNTDPSAAAEVRALRKPSVAAWVVNVFAVERTAQLAEALELAEHLREAQEDLDAKALSQLGRERRALTARLASMAADLAESRGERITAATRESVNQTLSAAFFDADAAVAVSSGRLVRALEPQGTFSDAMDTIVGGGAPATTARESRPHDEVAARRRRRDAERELRNAQRVRDDAADEATLATREVRKTARDSDALASRAAALEKELDEVRRDVELTRQELERAEVTERDAADKLADADAAVKRAEAALESLD
nr:transposase [Microbacterium hydrocarbonoxydans]